MPLAPRLNLKKTGKKLPDLDIREGLVKPKSTSLLTICGLDELGDHRARNVTHVLSILDPDWPEPEAFSAYDPHHRITLRFHDVIEPGPGYVLPAREHVEAILEFGRSMTSDSGEDTSHLLVHCHMGISRSTAAMAILMAQSQPETEEWIFSRLFELRPQAWPNSLMIEFADDLLGRRGRLVTALTGLYAEHLLRRPDYERILRSGGRGREVDMAKKP
jgi:predicted protein tyrosine phosphatase